MLDMVWGDCFSAISNISKANLHCWEISTKMQQIYLRPTRSGNFRWAEGMTTPGKAEIAFSSSVTPSVFIVFQHAVLCGWWLKGSHRILSCLSLVLKASNPFKLSTWMYIRKTLMQHAPNAFVQSWFFFFFSSTPVLYLDF